MKEKTTTTTPESTTESTAKKKSFKAWIPTLVTLAILVIAVCMLLVSAPTSGLSDMFGHDDGERETRRSQYEDEQKAMQNLGYNLVGSIWFGGEIPGDANTLEELISGALQHSDDVYNDNSAFNAEELEATLAQKEYVLQQYELTLSSLYAENPNHHSIPSLQADINALRAEIDALRAQLGK